MIKHCLACNAIISKGSKQWANQKYCTTKCRKAHHRKHKIAKTRIEQRKSNLLQNDETLYLIRQCKQAGTVQILTGHNISSFIETMELVRNRPKGEVNLCHISPVKGKQSTGLFHHLNLFYGGAYQNKKFKNKYISGGLSIRNAELKVKWVVAKEMSNKEVLVKIESFLENIISQYVALCPVRKSKKVQISSKIVEVDKSKNFFELMECSYKTLDEMWAKMTKASPSIICSGRKESKYLAYMDSISRFISYGGDRKITFEKLRRIMVIAYMALERIEYSQTYNKYFYVKYEPLIQHKYGQAMLRDPESWSELKNFIYEIAFESLQGADINIKKIQRVIMSYLVFPERAWTIKAPL